MSISSFRLSVTFLDRRFHGQGNYGPEWPPSPHRLFQALLAAAARSGVDNDAEFLWLESLDPPTILAPRVTAACEYRMFVPRNDADASKLLKREARLSEKPIRPTLIAAEENATVHYLWHIHPDDEPYAMRMREHARRLSALGWGVDLVVGDGANLTEEVAADLPGQRWAPTAPRGTTLRCPCPGSLADLRHVYDRFVSRIDGKVYSPAPKPSVYREVSYARTTDAPSSRPVASFALNHTDDANRSVAFSQLHSMLLAAMVRHVTIETARQAPEEFFPGGAEIYVAGHINKSDNPSVTPPRFSYLPLPTIGHPHSDGRIRRFMLVEPINGDGRYCGWARDVLHGKTLKSHSGQDLAVLMGTGSDGVINRYLEPGTVFESVTPVVLPGHDDHSYKKARKLVLKAMLQSGYPPEEFLEDVYLQQAPFWAGTPHPGQYGAPRKNAPPSICHVPKYMRHMSRIHVRLTFKKSVSGPVLIGAGRHIGLGILVKTAKD